jgi:hypothetical protein
MAEFINMPKKMREAISEEEQKQRDDIVFKLSLNLSLCFLKKEMKKECIKHA